MQSDGRISLCFAQEKNDIYNEDQNNIKKGDEFVPQNFEERRYTTEIKKNTKL